MNASFEEKSAWIQLVALVAVLGMYASAAGEMMAAGITTVRAFVPLLAGAITTLVVALVVGHIVAACTGAEDADERDRLIECRAESRSSWILASGAFGALVGLAASIDDIWIAHLLVGALFASEIAKLAFQVLYYRRGA